MPAGAARQHGGRLTAQDVISNELTTFSSMQVGVESTEACGFALTKACSSACTSGCILCSTRRGTNVLSYAHLHCVPCAALHLHVLHA
jgi:hypothetical protein